ncbi:MAG: transcriptional regulator, partial [Nanoarchaeota archaeon]|nr:transcriptional regulator [Nanoarchaeota archaeon]
ALSIGDLYKENHKSIPRNRVIAQIFYDAELIEKYGSGTTRMLELCKKREIFLEFREISGGLSAIFRKDIYTEEYLRDMGMNERQIKAVLYAKESKRITNKEYQQVCNTSERTASRELSELVKKSVFRQIGITGKGTAYILAAKGAKKAPKRRQM